MVFLSPRQRKPLRPNEKARLAAGFLIPLIRSASELYQPPSRVLIA
jgi:hypothetical protein